MGVVDDIAVLAETDIKNKEKIVQRKSLYSQLQGQIEQLSEAMKDKEGTIETLQRQLVQAGIKGKVKDAEIDIVKKREAIKGGMSKELIQTEAKQKLLQNVMNVQAQDVNNKANQQLKNQQQDFDMKKKEFEIEKKNLDNSKENE